MNLVFATPAHERTLPYTAIAERGRIGVEQARVLCFVSWLGMVRTVCGLCGWIRE